jgi:hypothetical protein
MAKAIKVIGVLWLKLVEIASALAVVGKNIKNAVYKET